MKRKLVCLLLAAVITTATFTGCGSSSGDNVDPITYITEVEAPEVIEGYFKENNLTVEGAGIEEEHTMKKFSYLGGIKTVKDNKELDAEYTGAIAINEKIDGDTKIITATILPYEEVKDAPENEEYYAGCIYGFVDRYTGTCYIENKELNPTTTIQVGDKEYELSFKFNPDDGVIEITCPKEYDGAAFFVCGTNETLEKENEKNLDKFVSISDITYGDYDMKFFAK